MKVKTITWVHPSDKNEPDALIMWTNEPLSSKCKTSFRIFKTKEDTRAFLENNNVYNKRQAIQMLAAI